MFRKTSNDLQLNLVLDTISSFSLSKTGLQAVKNAMPINDKTVWEERQNEVSDCVFSIIESHAQLLSAEFFPDLEETLSFIEKEPTASLEGTFIFDVAKYITSAVNLRKILCCANKERLFGIIENIDESLVYLVQEINKILESPGTVKESYPTVKALIEKANKCRYDRTKTAKQMMKANSSIMQEENAVLRDTRIVLPVRNEMHYKLEGYVQGSSQTGSTLFMEPFKLVDMNNEVTLAVQEIELEKARLVKYLSDLVRTQEQKIRVLVSSVTKADFLYAFSCWIIKNNCCRVILSDTCVCNLINARHPLLKNKCVPIDLKIDTCTKAVVLTGPNAGGKTVTMKTVGLFALLNQICGYVPASDGTSIALFDKVFTDIGDEQSIENSLSTFSGHMKCIAYILRSMTERSLVILDELGSGTDPQEGAALARSIMEYCTKKALLTLTTSHHGVLKQYAYSSSIVQNASMEFDEKTLEPTFKVICGLPGESHALDTARRMHLPKSVINFAEKYMGHEAVKISSIIRGLEEKQKEARDMENEIKSRLDQVKNTEKELKEKERSLYKLENNLKGKMLSDFDDFMNSSRKKLEGLVMELREGELTKEKIKKVKQHILDVEKHKGAMEEDLKKREVALEKTEYEELLQIKDNVELAPGMDVLCGEYKREGSIVRSAGKGKWVVAIGNIKFTFKETELSVPARKNNIKMSYSFAEGSIAPRPKLSLDLRGYRLLDALEAIDNEIESCCVHGITGFSVIHGYGDGILSSGIHKHLGLNANVAEYHFAHPEDGGQGKTYVSLK